MSVQTVDYVGRLMYSCLDWGLGADVERELDETLELLVDQMTKVDIGLGAERCLQPIGTISEVLQVDHQHLLVIFETICPFFLRSRVWRLLEVDPLMTRFSTCGNSTVQ